MNFDQFAYVLACLVNVANTGARLEVTGSESSLRISLTLCAVLIPVGRMLEAEGASKALA